MTFTGILSRVDLSIYFRQQPLQMNPSSTLARVQVREIGLRSFSISDGGLTLGIGVTMDDLRDGGRVPCSSDLRRRLGRLSGPMAFDVFSDDKERATSAIETKISLCTS